MRTHSHFLLLLFFPSLISAKSVIEPCNSSNSCNALLSYRLPFDSKLSEIASRFQSNVTQLKASNGIDPRNPFSGDEILSENTLLRVPIVCPCVDGIRRSLLIVYTVEAIDTIESIASGFGGLVSVEQINTANGLSGSDQLKVGQRLAIPLPCVCFNNSRNGVTVLYMSYVVGEGDSLRSIGETYGVTVTELVEVNGFGSPLVYTGDILAIPVQACSSAYLNLNQDDLIVPNGSYALTAFDCVECACGAEQEDLKLRCSPSPFATACKSFKCKGTDLFIGDVYEQTTKTGCDMITCLYRGYYGHQIVSSLSKSTQLQCSGNKTHSVLPPSEPPQLNQSRIPQEDISPSPNSASVPRSTSIQYQPTSTLESRTPVAGQASKHAFLLGFLVVEQIFLACGIGHDMCEEKVVCSVSFMDSIQ